jgi:hypothetical protein
MVWLAKSKAAELLGAELRVVNVGLDIFYQSLLQQRVRAVQVSLSPPPRLERQLSDALNKIL